jgi:Nucleoside-diphosphate-sugar epimerases
VSTQWDIVILGCGQLGRNLKTQLEIENCNVLGVRRTPMPEMPNMVACDLDQPETWEWLSQQPLSEQAVVVGIVTPDARTEAAYRARYVPAAKRMVEMGRGCPVGRIVWCGSVQPPFFGHTPNTVVVGMKPYHRPEA